MLLESKQMEKGEKEFEKSDGVQRKWIFQYFAAISVSFATISTGSILGWPSQITDNLLNGQLDISITSEELAWIYSSSALGSALLSLCIGPICDKIGRKTAMLLLIIPLEIGWILITFSTNMWMLIFGRIFTGMVGGAFCVSVPLYIDEIAHKEIRGVLGSLTQFMISCGILFSNIVGDFLTVRNFSASCAILPILFGITFVFMPETPIYLARKGRTEDAEVSLKKLRGTSHITDELNEIYKTLMMETKVQPGKEVLGKKSFKKACLISVALSFFRIFTGIDPITAYLSHIFENTNAVLNPKTCAIAFAAVQVFAVVPQILVVDRWGRKILLVTAQFAMALCLLSTALCSYYKDDSTEFLRYIPTISLCIYIMAFCVGIGPIGWIISAEIFEDKVKSRAMSFCTFLVWILAFGNVKLFEIIEDNQGEFVSFFLYSGASLVGAIFIWVLVPETKNKTFEEIEEDLSS